MRAALLRPWGLIVLAIGAFFFAATLEWWVVPLTLATYASLVFLAAREDTTVQRRRMPGDAGEIPPETSKRSARRPRPSPEQRARRLPEGETRQKVEAALEAHGRVLVAVEGSDEATQAALSGAVPKLYRIPDRLLDVAEARETAAEEALALRSPGTRPGENERTARLSELEEGLRAADAELSGASERLATLRAEVVRVSIESGDAAATRARELTGSLDAWNLRLDALGSTLPVSDQR